MNIWSFVNVFVANLPVILLYIMVKIPSFGTDTAFINTKVGTYYLGDSARSEVYNVSMGEEAIVTKMWVNGTNTDSMQKYLKQRSFEANKKGGTMARCGFRWQYKGVEVGGYCYNGKTKTDFASPNVQSFLRSTIGSTPVVTRVALMSEVDLKSEFNMSWTIRIGDAEYTAYPMTNFTNHIKTYLADYLVPVSCQIGNTVFNQYVSSWKLFLKGTPFRSLKPSTTTAKFLIASRGSNYDYGTLFRARTSYTTVAAYCESVVKGKVFVGWGGQFFSSNTKEAGFLLGYWPLLMMYVIALTMTGGVYGKWIFRGYNAYIQTGAASSTAFQVFLFNERLYYLLYNLIGSKDFVTFFNYFKAEVGLISAAAIIFQYFIVCVFVKATLGRHYSKYWRKMRYVAGVYNLCALTIYLLTSHNRADTGIYRTCGASVVRCFYPYNSTRGYVLINVFGYVLQSLVVNLYFAFGRESRHASKGSLLKVTPNIQISPNVELNKQSIFVTPKTSFERYCLNCGVPQNLNDVNIYKTIDNKVYTVPGFVLFHGFMQLQNVGIIRTKDLWIIYSCKYLPYVIRKRFSISLIIWSIAKPNTVQAPYRLFWDHLEIKNIEGIFKPIGQE